MRKLILLSIVLVPFFLFAQKHQKSPKTPKAPKTEKPQKTQKPDKKCANDEFTGTSRKMAKTTFASPKDAEVFADLASFLGSLPDDKSMTTRNPPISNQPYFLRVTEENRNVKIAVAYVFAITRQDDNDFLITLGSDPDYSKARFFNVEVSGLPESSKDSYSTLNAVRTAVKAQFGNVCGKPMLYMDKPVKVSVAGSLFFDAENKPGKNDPKKLKSATSWEIHPVAEISFN